MPLLHQGDSSVVSCGAGLAHWLQKLARPAGIDSSSRGIRRGDQEYNMTKPINTFLITAISCLLACPLVFKALAGSPIHPAGTVSDTSSAVPLGIKDVAAVMPLTGETLQLYVNGIYYKGPTPNKTLTNFGVFGTDEGYPVQVDNQIIFFFGDTLGAYRDRDGDFIRYTENRGADSIAYMPNQPMANCHYIPGLISQLSAGNHHPTPDTSGCPLLKFYTNPAHSPFQPAFQPITINGLAESEGTGPAETPVGTFYYNGYLYMFYSDMIQPTGIAKHSYFHLETILTKSTEPLTRFSAKNPPVFAKLYVASAHPEIVDISSPPNERDGAGKFIRPAPLVFSHAALAADGMLGGLPQELQSAQQVILLFGTSWKNTSNLYLAAVDAGKIESGTGAWWYLVNAKSGASGWSHDESSAQPLFSNWNLTGKPSVGEHGVIWSDELHRFILMYSHHREAPTGGIVARFSSLPWGPWSEEVSVLLTEDTLAKEIYHHDSDPITSNNAPWYNPKRKMPVQIDDTNAGPYGPYFTGQHNVNKDGSVTYYFTVSPFVPYEVFLMQATFCGTPSCK